MPRIRLSLVGERIRFWSTVYISRLPPNRYRSIFVLGYPRTGTNWLCGVVSHYFGIPISEPWLRKLPTVEPVVLHLHRFVVVPRRTLYMIRDGRDIVVSHYHKFLADPGSPLLRGASRFCAHPVSHENIRINLPGYIRYLFEGKVPSSMRLDRHVRRARTLGLYTVRYEDMLESGEKALAGIVKHLCGRAPDPLRIHQALEANRFEKHAGRKRGEEDFCSVVTRKGIAGDWKNNFTREAARVFDDYAGDLLIECGYEADHRWVERIPERPGE